jgi:SAM-dependent methyltransferase
MSRCFGSESKPLFGGDISVIYARIAKQHAHPTGPWLKILDAVRTEVGREGKSNAPFTVLDLASGPGEPGITIAKHFPSADVTITDIADSQIEIATANAKGLNNTRCMIADAENLSQFPDNSFDIVTSCYGYMFCKDLPRAFSEALRVTKPGGSLILTYWLQLPMMDLQHATMETVLGAAPPPPAINPLTLSSRGLVPSELHKANFQDITTSVSEYPFEMGATDDEVFQAATLPIRGALQDLAAGGRSEAVDRGKEVFWRMLEGSRHHTKRADGMRVISGNVFEMAVARKKK